VIGAFVVALLEAYLARYWDPGAQQIVILVLFLLVLYVQAVGVSRRTPRFLRRAPAPASG
jgi:branched-subunit amino acid ABC-type transport system permease component